MSMGRKFRALAESLAPHRLTRVLRGPALALFVTGLVTNVVTILTSLFTLLVYDKVYPHDGVATLVALTTGTLALMAVDAGLRLFRTQLINEALFGGNVPKPLRYFREKFRLVGQDQKKQLNYLETAIQDLTVVQASDVRTATVMVELPFMLVLFVAIALIAGQLVWVPLIAVTAMLVVTLLTMDKAREAARKVDEDKRVAIQTLAHSARGADWFFGMGAWGWLQAKDAKLSGALKQSSAQLASVNQIRQLATQVISQLISIATVFFGFFLFRDGTLTFGGVIASYILSTRCLSPLANLSQIPSSSESEKVGSVDTRTEEFEGPSYSLPVDTGLFRLDIADLSYVYPGRNKPALKISRLEVAAGEKIAIVGRSGSGKTTLARLLVRALGHSGGQIRCMGLPLEDIEPEQWERYCLYVPQVPWFGDGSAFDQIRLGQDLVADEELARIVHQLGLQDLFAGRSSGAGQGDGLSTGQIQLLGLMRCLVRQAPLVILDEPTNSLDQESESRVMDAIFKHFEKSTLLLITHKRSLVDRMDRVWVMDNGTLVRDVPVQKAVSSEVKA